MLACWQLALQEYNFGICYCTDKNNLAADALSQEPFCFCDTTDAEHRAIVPVNCLDINWTDNMNEIEAGDALIIDVNASFYWYHKIH